jgi:hypothetical protein
MAPCAFVLTSESYDVSQVAVASSSGGDRLHIVIEPGQRSPSPVFQSNSKEPSLYTSIHTTRPLYTTSQQPCVSKASLSTHRLSDTTLKAQELQRQTDSERQSQQDTAV